MSEAMGISSYEQSRENRIKENLERMQKLGIVDLSLKLNSSIKPTPKRRYQKKTPQTTPSVPTPAGPVRRSSRLQNSTPVSYSEVTNSKEDDDRNLMREVGAKPEVYDEEHEKLLGSTETSWTLFVDGYGKDGKRIYDPVRGKTCHQCRQKTLGHRTHCSECKMVQGQFCGDCLYMRYGENVLEANQNPNWICPVCRGICNCSLCRQAKGWPATGTLYRKSSSLGYKSVAHYLIQTRRANKEDSVKDDVGSKAPVSAKRSLPFAGIEATPDQDDLSKPTCEHLKTGDPLPEPENSGSVSCENEKESILVDVKLDERYSKPLPVPEKYGSMPFDNEKESVLVDIKVDESISEPEKYGPVLELNDSLTPISETIEGGNDKEIKKDEIAVGSESSPKSTKERRAVAPPPTPDSIGGRLRQRRISTYEEHSTKDAEDMTIPDVIAVSSRKKHNEELEMMAREKNAEGTVTAETESIGARLKRRRRA